MNQLLNCALKYRRRGLSVIPLKPKGKEPLIEWKEFQNRIASEEEIRSWYAKTPTANIGIVTGSVSELAVVDLDGKEGLESCQRLSLTSPIISLTGNGKHLWFKYHEGLKNSVRKIADGVDVRAEGGFIVAPPSIHPNGKKYLWSTSALYFVLRGTKLPTFPTECLSVVVEKKALEVKQESWISEALEELKNGHVHSTLVSVLGKFRFHGFSIDDTYKLLYPHCFENGEHFSGLKAKIEEIWGRYEAGTRINKEVCGNLSGLATISIHSPENADDYADFKNSDKGLSGIREIKSGFPSLDKMLQGGIKSERLFTLAARTGENKTNTALAICANLSKQGQKVLYFSTEFGFRKIWSRYEAYCDLKQYPIHVCDAFSPSIEQVEEALKRFLPDIFVFDYIQHVSKQYEAISNFFKGLNLLQKTYNCQGIVLAQLGRSADFIENGKRVIPRLSMIEGSDLIGQGSSRILLLSRERITDDAEELTAVLDKNDEGTMGMFHLVLKNNPYRIQEV